MNTPTQALRSLNEAFRNSQSSSTMNVDDSHNSFTMNVDDNYDQDADVLTYPEGGAEAWTTLFGAFLGIFSSFGLVNSVSAIETYISHHQLENVSSSVVGWVFSIFVFISLLFGVLTGHFFDTHGPKIPIFLGTVLTFVGMFATANCTAIYQFILAFGVVTGLGMAVQMSPLVGVISHYFNKRRGTMVGLATTGGSIGGAIFPIMLRKLYATVGFPWAMRIFGIILTVLDLAALLIIKPRFPPKKATAGDTAVSWKQRLVNYLCNSIDFAAFRDPRFVTCVLAATFAELCLFTAMTYYGSYSLSMGNSEDITYLLITLINVAGIPSRGLAGYGSDKIGKFNLMTVMMFFAAVFCLAIWLPFGQHVSGLYVFSIAFGLASPAVLSLAPLCVSQISRTEDFGKRYSTCYFVVAFGCLVGIPISGLFIENQGTQKNYNPYIIFVSVLGFACAAFLVVSRYIAVKFKLVIY